MVYLYMSILGIGIGALVLVFILLRNVKSLSEGTPEMVAKASIIQRGADAFMITIYKVIIPVVAVIALLFSLFVEKSLGLVVIVGAAMSSCACIIGMKGAIYAGVRTANVARVTLDIGQTMRVALKGGSIAGFSVPAFALIGFAGMQLCVGGIDLHATSHGFLLNLVCNPSFQRVAAYSLGCSVVAMFNRVAGGNFTKAADVSADTVSKVRLAKANIRQKFAHYQREQITKQLEAILETGLDEDSFLNPSVLADFIGDCVNDIAGNCSDLLESFVATISASYLIAQSFSAMLGDYGYFDRLIAFPTMLVGIGLIGSMLSLPFALTPKATKRPSSAINMFSNLSAVITGVLGSIAAFFCFGKVNIPGFALGWFSPIIAAATGISSGIAIGKITEYYTSGDFKPVRRLAEAAKEGAAFVITRGDALGSRSVLLPIVVVGSSLLISYLVCGDYGIAIASLGMLSFVASTVSIDAFGPIADNAGGLAEACGLSHLVRAITDQLDAFGNTTAAIGKGYAISSAAFATVALIKAFVAASDTDLIASNTYVVVGMLIGAGVIELFIAMLSDNTIDSATKMADESERQLMDGVLAGLKQPDHIKCIVMATKEALRKMVAPSLLACAIPVAIALIFGNRVLGGLLIGATIVAIPRALFMGNSGGAFDNAKKTIELGLIEGASKGSEAHVAAVVGDTTGDTRKDVVGVALDIFIKDMSTIANLIAPLSRVYHLF